MSRDGIKDDDAEGLIPNPLDQPCGWCGRAWCVDEGKDRAGTKAVFSRDLHAAYPGVRATRPRVLGQRVHTLVGIDLRRTEDGLEGDEA